MAVRTFRYDCRGLHDLAVLYWCHRTFPMQFNPKEIKVMLEIAQEESVSCAKENLKILNAHVPEVNRHRQDKR